MKRIILILASIIFLSSYAKSQIVIGMGAGYTSFKSPVFNLNIGYKFEKSNLYYSQIVPLSRRSDAPIILGVRYGYSFGDFQPYIGADYHLLSSDKTKAYKPQEGYKLAFGLSKYFQKMPLKLDIGMSGKYFIGSIGFYKIL